MKTLLFLAFSLFPLFSLADEEVRWHETSAGVVHIRTLHEEEGLWMVDHFRLDPGKLQEKVSHRSFSSEARARNRFDQLTEGYLSGSPRMARSVDTEVAGEVLWRSTEKWSWAWEERYAQWLSTMNGKFFLDNKIGTDCADVAYGFRWIFSRINGLPAVNRLSGSGQLFTNESMRAEWKKLPTSSDWRKDKRFLAALEYFLDNTYTHSLMKDVYPVRIDASTLLVGTIFMHLYPTGSGHAEQIYRVDDPSQPAPIRVLASTVPQAVREISEYGIQDWGSLPTRSTAGIMRFRWPDYRNGKWMIVPETEMSDYSLQQYDPSFAAGYGNFVRALLKRHLPAWAPSPGGALGESVATLMNRLRVRVAIVQDGYAACSRSPCKEGSSSWEEWSTPSRDAAILRLVQETMALYSAPDCDATCRNMLEEAKPVALTAINSRPYTLIDAIDVWQKGKYVSDPNKSIAKRWGR